ncbi:YjbH domain-containing protein [Paracoccus mutanolyticus]|uniref:YjbH domain-containing protein n=1 Tax=Paracoccus mutanolyticus TaxID=1499308 RepID=UPI0021D5221E|nr:YjbH domain-containing protein [Paracoccus mutanolyticus]
MPSGWTTRTTENSISAGRLRAGRPAFRPAVQRRHGSAAISVPVGAGEGAGAGPAAPAPAADPDGWSGAWSADPTAQPAIQKALGDALAKEGQMLESMALDANRAEVRIRNNRYIQQAEAVGRTARLMTRALPPSVETFVITSSGTACRPRRSRCAGRMSNGWKTARQAGLPASPWSATPIRGPAIWCGRQASFRASAGR